jgi:uncharacterized protein (TIGR03067 family)
MSGDQPPHVTGQWRGAWRVVKLIDGGDDIPREEDGDNYLWITDPFIVTGDQWAAWRMPYIIRADCTPMEIDITRGDLPDSWIQKGIIEVVSDLLRICGAGSVTRPRPSTFSSTVADGQVLYVAERCNEPVPV